MALTQFTSLDFDEIKQSIKDYLRANSTFTDYDFEGSNLSMLINALAYNTYLTSYNANMVANESFLDSATLRENVVALARNIGYVPRSRRAARATISFSVTLSSELTYNNLTLKAGLVCTGASGERNYKFVIPEDITVPVVASVANFSNIVVYEGNYTTKKWTVTEDQYNQRFILDNPFVDTSTIRVKVIDSAESNREETYSLVDNIIGVDANSRVYLIQEIEDERYQLLFGDGIIGKKVDNNNIISTSYVVTSGEQGNGASNFIFSGIIYGNNIESNPVTTTISDITTNEVSNGGSEIETVSSIKYYAPRLYQAQYRAVSAKDFETVIPYLYDNAESVSAYGGEELNPPQYGKVFIAVKPKNSNYLSTFAKREILNKLKNYTVAGIVTEFVDLKYLFVETNSSIYYSSNFVGNVDALRTRVLDAVNAYSRSVDINKFGGRFKYSNLTTLIDQTDQSIVSNITTVKMVRNLRVNKNVYTQYELCYGNQFNVNARGYNIKSTGFTVSGIQGTLYFTDIPETTKVGRLIIFKILDNNNILVVKRKAGTVNYISGEINIDTIAFSSTERPEDIIEIEVAPESNDVIGKNDLYVQYKSDRSIFNMVIDSIASGSTSGTTYIPTSSYPNSNQYIRVV
jgi:hypothetical protein